MPKFERIWDLDSEDCLFDFSDTYTLIDPTCSHNDESEDSDAVFQSMLSEVVDHLIENQEAIRVRTLEPIV